VVRFIKRAARIVVWSRGPTGRNTHGDQNDLGTFNRHISRSCRQPLSL
jgi:hypothetical protein